MLLLPHSILFLFEPLMQPFFFYELYWIIYGLKLYIKSKCKK